MYILNKACSNEYSLSYFKQINLKFLYFRIKIHLKINYKITENLETMYKQISEVKMEKNNKVHPLLEVFVHAGVDW